MTTPVSAANSDEAEGDERGGRPKSQSGPDRRLPTARSTIAATTIRLGNGVWRTSGRACELIPEARLEALRGRDLAVETLVRRTRARAARTTMSPSGRRAPTAPRAASSTSAATDRAPTTAAAPRAASARGTAREAGRTLSSPSAAPRRPRAGGLRPSRRGSRVADDRAPSSSSKAAHEEHGAERHAPDEQRLLRAVARHVDGERRRGEGGDRNPGDEQPARVEAPPRSARGRREPPPEASRR